MTPTLPRRPRWRSLALLALCLAPLLWPLQHLAERYYRSELVGQNRQTLDLYVANLLGTLHRYEVLPQILGDLPALRAVLAAPYEPQATDNANRLLKDIRAQTGAEVMYLMDTHGKTLAASNWDKHDSFVGRNFAFRPYFSEAMQGRLGRFFGLGTTSAKRGYFFAGAVRDGEQIIGVLVVKVDLDHTESLWGKTPEQLLLTDHNGVVIITSRPEWRFRATRPLTDEERHAISAVQPYPTRDPQPLNLNPDAWLIQTQQIEETGWSVSILAPRTLIDRPVRTVVAIGGATLLVLMLLLGLMMQRRRHYLQRIAFEAKTRRELEARVAERTSDLEGLNRRLKQEVLEREQAQQELVRAQDDLVQAGKLSALGTMSASISHELNQPLAAIRSYAENAEVLLDHQRTDDARGNLKLISELTGRMASIIAHLRAFARRDRHAPESVALQPALDDALALLAKRRRAMEVELIRDLPAATLWVEAGETRLRQVLGNLLANALDALTEKGPPRKLWLSAESTADGVNLYIRDNGPGFCMEALGRAGEPFYTTKTRTQGLGLGLAICDTLMRAFGGELSFANHKEGGALITLRLRAGAPGVSLQPSEDRSE
ncbi:two-component system sensor histidine kinase AtoS [Pseudomonas sp. FW306-02-F02-AA]|uniref:C4-dicarboxylate transport sensor protein DctB n=1 Tax=Pseudomonas fluorescens TaxID=294 RepID=A0A0N7GZZ8_PSEFL|nr:MULTISPECIES: ATP-binding protein [Pseudomonas]ALI01740.1 ATPase [Pseudomonas fluorescens]PMZ05217.1 two-component system sensor histidine kinase AtoS [Pseudomonas sp. FW306-02-F02-AB]PMZ08624.1 two-component system sensor histidine kinase AtoS [Pseudomonas sp. FW306-02-H06C]PMZ14542.1 two-component system sensor histidine kinase AtoS [Pseudomonas sp. FW306-02-F02-AA]PMZ19908.1 two-component system sensor histidine kinase AtoS [Pseudomonas sp. FW306-02-F08-AA]